MDRLLIIEPTELVLKFELGLKSSATVQLKNVMFTMPVAFEVQPTAPTRYSIQPSSGIISPLGVVSFEIVLNPQTQLPCSFPFSDDKFLVKSVVVPGGSDNEAVCLEWFTAKKKQVFSDHGMRVVFIGGGILRRLVADGYMEDIREVLERDEKLVDSKDEQGRTAMHIAVASGRPELVQLLLEFKADVEIKSRSGQTALQEAASGGETLMVELLLAKGARADAKNPSGWTALHYAVMGGHADVVKLLLEKGAQVDSAVQDGRTALHMAVAEGRQGCLELLLQEGANVDLRSSDGEAPLHKAASRGDVATVELLLNYGANQDIRNSKGKRPFDCALPSGKQKLLDVLSLGDDLRRGARKGQLKDVQQFLTGGASANGRDQHGWTALHRAAFKGYVEVVGFLLENGADLHSKDEAGYTVLHCATEAGQKDVVQLLLKKGADINARRSNSGGTALDLATHLNYSGIIRLLLEWGASKDAAVHHQGRTAFDKLEKDYCISPPLKSPSESVIADSSLHRPQGDDGLCMMIPILEVCVQSHLGNLEFLKKLKFRPSRFESE